jgi:predicted SAM-dependent methyltransferase
MEKCAIDIGCGEIKKDRAIGVDFRKTPCVNVVADARCLPFRDESLDHVFSSHIIEHFSRQEVDTILTEWVRCLKKGGVFEVRCPDLRARAFLFALSPSKQNIRNIYGEQDYPGNFHKNGFSFGILQNLLQQHGILNIKRIMKGYKGIPFLPDCLHLKGIKE